jgi:glycosyltransferase involved in cell wall biosynthesis
MESRFLAFVTASGEVQRVEPGVRLHSPLASDRLRMLLPAEQLARRLPVYLVPLHVFLGNPQLGTLGTPAAIIIAKLPVGLVAANSGPLRGLIAALDRNPGLPVFADLSDNYASLAPVLGNAFLAEYQEGLASHCGLIVPCAELERQLAPYAKRGIRVVEDPYESATAQPARMRPGGTLRLCWFGNLGKPNLGLLESTILGVAAHLASRVHTIDLALVCGPAGESFVAGLRARLNAVHAGFGLRHVPWSPETMAAALAAADIVLLPQETGTEWGRAKSHNRAVETLRAGRFAVASPIPSYLELAEFLWAGDDLAAGVSWALEHPGEAEARIAAGQQYVERRFAPDAVARRWIAALGIPT